MSRPPVVADFEDAHHDSYPAIAQSNHQGRTVLITGASKGIGRATAVSFARAGASGIILAARSSLDEVEKDVLEAAPKSSARPKVLKLRLDVSSNSNVAEAAAAVEKEFDHIDILINNAGYLETWKPIAESDPEEWWKTWEINVKGVYLVTRAFLPLVLKSSEKTILNVSSTGALRFSAGGSGYQTTKLAILKFTGFIVNDYQEQGVVSYALHPGGVGTELATNMPAQFHSVLKDKAELAGDTFAWLTQERRPWLNGRYLSVNWDMPGLMARRAEIERDDRFKMRLS